ncbi:MAG: anthranilate phosphoribosyltransferase [Methanosarcinales archaeon]|nr:anthranilate phosphoribosyltransferase [Methanosarcinales archaeon]
MKEYIQSISERKNLSMEQAEGAIASIFTDATDAQIGAFLMGIKMKGETIDEIAGFARGMRAAARTIAPDVAGTLVDTCGTGGDVHNTINVSTAAAIVTAAAGIPVAKHGNYAITSKSGSADVLKTLGIRIDLPPERVSECIEKVGIGFLLAPVFHPAMKRVAMPRRELGVRTVFNILGPLTNPAGARAQVIGVFDPALCETFARVLALLGSERAMVVHGDGMDEISNISETVVASLDEGEVSTYTVKPEDFGLERAKVADIAGGTPEENAHDIVSIFEGVGGAKRDVVVLNSGAAIYVSGTVSDLAAGVRKAEAVIDSGAALRKLREFVEFAG